MYKIDSRLKLTDFKRMSIISDINSSKRYNKIFLLTEKSLYSIYSHDEIFTSGFHLIFTDKSKDSKNIESVKDITEQLMLSGCTRDSLLIGFGGGSVTDITGFVASIYMRGIDHIFIPTTLLAMVDAAIGGKTGIDFLGVKNLLGTFKHPQGIYLETKYLHSLSKKQIINGFAEIIKCGLIFDSNMFGEIVENFNSFINAEKIEQLEPIIIKSCKHKINVVLQDQLDNNKRMVLNFGHTIGHALEAYYCNNHILHGEAVYYGMLVESLASNNLGYLSNNEFNLINDFLNSIPKFKVKNLNENKLLSLIKYDKKQIRNKMHFILLDKIGNAVIREDIKPQVLKEPIVKILMQ